MRRATKPEIAVVSLAAIRSPRRGAREYLFFERQQIFSLRPREARRADTLNLLRRALREKTPLKVVLDPRGGEIQQVQLPTPDEVETFKQGKIPADVRGTTRKIDLPRLDPTTFNVVELQLRSPIFRLCRETVPSYKKAKKIFDFCAKQGCYLGGPFDISPCIPFQYVIDGCYARAHKMRQIITTKYRYCCEKVFSFANHGSDTLAVKADKWGGCCVYWWYHVAPLVRVKVRFGKFRIWLAVVIDPGMFDKPVLLSTWLAAQANKTCSANANVSMYSIQPGSAYWPTSFSGTTFATDPNYVLTDGTLNSYKNLKTCS